MKRDWDLLREQLLAIEEDRDFKTVVLAAVPEELTWQDGQSEADFLKLKVEQKNIEERIFGHLEMLVDNGPLQLLARRAKTLHEVPGQSFLNVEFNPADKFYLKKAGAYSPIKNKSALLRLFNDHRREVQQQKD